MAAKKKYGRYPRSDWSRDIGNVHGLARKESTRHAGSGARQDVQTRKFGRRNADTNNMERTSSGAITMRDQLDVVAADGCARINSQDRSWSATHQGAFGQP